MLEQERMDHKKALERHVSNIGNMVAALTSVLCRCGVLSQLVERSDKDENIKACEAICNIDVKVTTLWGDVIEALDKITDAEMKGSIMLSKARDK